MSGEEADKMLCCASCGVKEDNDITLKKCNGCYLVKYCGVKCQREHRPQHKKECKKRAAELSYGTNYYLSNLKATISVIARSVICRYRFIQRNLH